MKKRETKTTGFRGRKQKSSITTAALPGFRPPPGYYKLSIKKFGRLRGTKNAGIGPGSSALLLPKGGHPIRALPSGTSDKSALGPGPPACIICSDRMQAL
jgi:hypothetical protein